MHARARARSMFLLNYANNSSAIRAGPLFFFCEEDIHVLALHYLSLRGPIISQDLNRKFSETDLLFKVNERLNHVLIESLINVFVFNISKFLKRP